MSAGAAGLHGHRLIRAAAGSGKTFQLTNRFIGLLVAGAPPERILATTFTRKAAGEILARVLVRLAEAARSPEGCAALAGHLEGDLDLTPARALALLEGVARRLHRLRVSTLDSFFLHIADGFTLDLGLPAGWSIVDEDEERRVRDEAISELLADGHALDLARLLRLAAQDELRRPIDGQIRDAVTGIHGVFLDTDEAAWTWIPRPPRLSRKEIEGLCEELRGLSVPTTRSGRPHKRWAATRDASLAAAEAGNWLGLTGKGIAAKIAAGEDRYHGIDIDDD